MTEAERICKLMEERANLPVAEVVVDPWEEEQQRVGRRIAGRRKAHPEESEQTSKWLAVLDDVLADPEVVAQMQEAKAARQKASETQHDDLEGYVPGHAAVKPVSAEPPPEPHTLAAKFARGKRGSSGSTMPPVYNQQPLPENLSDPMNPRWKVAQPTQPPLDGYDSWGNKMPI